MTDRRTTKRLQEVEQLLKQLLNGALLTRINVLCTPSQKAQQAGLNKKGDERH